MSLGSGAPKAFWGSEVFCVACEKRERERERERVEDNMGGDRIIVMIFNLLRLNKYIRKTFSPAVVLDGLKDIMASSPLLNTLAETGQFSFSVLLSWAGFAAGGPAVALLGTMASLLAQAGLEAGRRAMELMIYQEIAKEIPSNLFDMLTEKCLYKREARTEATWNGTQQELVSAGKDAIAKVTETVQTAGKSLSDQMSRWTSFLSSVKNTDQ